MHRGFWTVYPGPNTGGWEEGGGGCRRCQMRGWEMGGGGRGFELVPAGRRRDEGGWRAAAVREVTRGG